MQRKLIGSLILSALVLVLGAAARKTYLDIRRNDLNRRLIAAVKASDSASVIARLAAGADANSQDLPPDTRSMWRVLSDTVSGRVTRSVYNNGSEPSALMLALASRDDLFPLDTPRVPLPPQNVLIVKALLRAGASVNVYDGVRRTPLMWAAKRTAPDVVQLLLDRGARIDNVDSNNATVLHWAARGDPSVVQLLLSRGAQVDVADNNGVTPLSLAADSGSVGSVGMLLRSGANPNRSRNDGVTPLSLGGGSLGCVKLLLAAGASVNMSDKDGNTPLSSAAEGNSVECARLLIAHGARVNTRNLAGKTPLMLAIQGNNATIVAMLKRAGAQDFKTLRPK